MSEKIKVVETIKELKAGKQGTVLRTKEEGTQIVYRFGLWCKCGKKVQGCFCTYTLEDAKKAIEKSMWCDDCLSKSKKYIKFVRGSKFIMGEIQKMVKKKYVADITDKEIMEYAPEIWVDDVDGYYGDGLYECECPLDEKED